VSAAIELQGVRKTFGSTVAVDDLDLVVPEGSIYGFIGPNGAGKTTTIRIIVSILLPDAGVVRILGHRSALEARDRIGYLPEERGIYRKMKVGAFLRYIGNLKGVPSRDVGRKVRTWLERVELPDVEGKVCDELSKGMLQKVQFITAVLHDPDLLILDEPFSGLDPVNMRLMRDLIVEQRERGTTIIFSTHVMPQAEQLCEHVIMLHHGRKVLDDAVSGIRAKYDTGCIVLEPAQPDTDTSALAGIPGVMSSRRENGTIRIAIREGADPSQLLADVVRTIPAVSAEVERPTLEDVFVRIVRDDVTESEA